MKETSAPWIHGLNNPECYPHPVDQIRLIETHISWVILTGRFAYKIKKPVKYSFVDFSTLEQRRWFCEEEVRLNCRLAREVYLGVVPITGTPTNPCIDGEGSPFEFAVKMKQFSADQEIYDILDNENNGEVCVAQLAEEIATFHAHIERAEEDSIYGHPDRVWQPMKECLEEIPCQNLTQTTQQYLSAVTVWLQTEWQNLSDVFLHRKKTGFVRECHGDLHLGNISMFEGNVCVFDALEFEPRLRWIDVMSEIAFLVMDLEKYGYKDWASVFLNRYLEVTGDYEGLVLLRFYKVYRALVRGKVAGLRLTQLAERGMEGELTKRHLTGYIGLAHGFITSASSALILMHGVSGTGKTTVSTEIVKAIGAIRIRSDVERKRLFSRKLNLKSQASHQVGLYHSDMTEWTYNYLRELASLLLQARLFVVIDAAFLKQCQRESFMGLANEQACPFVILDVFAPKEVLEERIKRRSRKGRDASDATVEVMKRQLENEEPFSQGEHMYVSCVDSTDIEGVRAAIAALSAKVNS